MVTGLREAGGIESYKQKITVKIMLEEWDTRQVK